jgi:hypothetical protein
LSPLNASPQYTHRFRSPLIVSPSTKRQVRHHLGSLRALDEASGARHARGVAIVASSPQSPVLRGSYGGIEGPVMRWTPTSLPPIPWRSPSPAQDADRAMPPILSAFSSSEQVEWGEFPFLRINERAARCCERPDNPPRSGVI